ncbi:hypothetical protein MKX01_018190, partial [Papaver californicum]
MIKFGAEWLHMDIMDGHFVPNITIGAPVIESLRKHTTAFLDCHPMATNPLDYLESLGKAGASGFTFHVEASKVEAKNPVDMILVMTVEPGFGGQNSTACSLEDLTNFTWGRLNAFVARTNLTSKHPITLTESAPL